MKSLVFVPVYSIMHLLCSKKNRHKKTPEPIETTCSGVMELIAGFEPATSSLPRMRSTD